MTRTPPLPRPLSAARRLSDGGGQDNPLSQLDGYLGLMTTGALGIVQSSMNTVRSGINDAVPGELRADAGDAMRFFRGWPRFAGRFDDRTRHFQHARQPHAEHQCRRRDTEQIGVAKVVTVGQVYNQTVGHTKNVTIGKELFIGVGGGKDKDGNDQPPKSILIMKDDGTIVLKGVRIYIDAESHIQLIAPMVDNN